MMSDIEKQTTSHDPMDVTPTMTNNDTIARVTTSGTDNEFVHIGNQKIRRDELMQAFGGTLMPGVSAPPSRKFANPAPLGLSAFALTTFVLSMVNAQAMSITIPNVVVGSAAFYGGLVQLLAGMWEMAVENTFGGLALSSYGGFWMSYAAIQIPWFGIKSAYGTDERGLQVAVGFFLLGWTIFTFMLLLATVKSTVAFFSLFFFLDLTFLMLAIGDLGGVHNCTRAGGVLGVITAFIAWYNAFAGLATKQNSYFTVHGLALPGAKPKYK